MVHENNGELNDMPYSKIKSNGSKIKSQKKKKRVIECLACNIRFSSKVVLERHLLPKGYKKG